MKTIKDNKKDQENKQNKMHQENKNKYKNH